MKAGKLLAFMLRLRITAITRAGRNARVAAASPASATGRRYGAGEHGGGAVALGAGAGCGTAASEVEN